MQEKRFLTSRQKVILRKAIHQKENKPNYAAFAKSVKEIRLKKLTAELGLQPTQNIMSSETCDKIPDQQFTQLSLFDLLETV